MFYQASQLDSLLTCTFCDQKFNDPRVLPCGKSFCKCCIDVLVTQKQIKCNHCSQTHQVPDGDGFPPNIELAKMLDLKSSHVCHSKLFQTFKDMLDSVRAKAGQLELGLKIGDAQIRDYCDKVRNDAQLAIEQAHEQLDKIHKQLMDEIDEHERECQKQFKLASSQDTRADTHAILAETAEFQAKSETMLAEFCVDEVKIKASLCEAYRLVDELEKADEKLRRRMFNGTLLKFVKSEDAVSVGRIKRQDIGLHFLENTLSRREIDLLALFNGKEIDIISIQAFKNGSFLCAYVASSDNLNVFQFDRDGSVLIERNNLVCSEDLLQIDYFQCLTALDKTFYIFTIEKHSSQQESIYMLRSFDEHLNAISVMKLEGASFTFAVFDSSLFILSKQSDFDDFKSITSYGPDLHVMQKVGQNNVSLPFYLPISLNGFLADETCFILEREVDERREIMLISKASGLVEKTFSVRTFDDWSIYMQTFILLFCFETNTIIAYSFSGQLIEETKLSADLDLKALAYVHKKEIGLIPSPDFKLLII